MDNNHIASDVEKSNSTQSMPHQATKLEKLAKVTAYYMKIEELRPRSPCRIFLLYLHIILKPSHCPIVMDEGSDVYSDTSAVIGPYGICCLCSQIKREDALNLIQ